MHCNDNNQPLGKGCVQELLVTRAEIYEVFLHKYIGCCLIGHLQIYIVFVLITIVSFVFVLIIIVLVIITFVNIVFVLLNIVIVLINIVFIGTSLIFLAPP